MNEHDATEIAFKNGYEKAKQEIQKIIDAKIRKLDYKIKNTCYYDEYMTTSVQKETLKELMKEIRFYLS